jgi:DNA-binding HxlR family transcriptional regulator
MKHFPNVPDRIKCLTEILPTSDTVELLSGKWKVLIILALLAKGRSRFNELVADIGTITPKMLSKELRDLEQNQLVTRTVQATIPVTVEYQLTTHGRSLEPLIAAMRDWGIKHRARIAGPRARVKTASPRKP